MRARGGETVILRAKKKKRKGEGDSADSGSRLPSRGEEAPPAAYRRPLISSEDNVSQSG